VTRRGRWVFLYAPLAVVSGVAFLCVGAKWWIERAAEPYATRSLEAVPALPVALVLGTAPTIAGGGRNPYFEYRLDAAAALYKAGRVKFLLVSGDNRRRSYDEPSGMKDGLVARGVPGTAIYRDYAGLRTLDSVLRARDVFGQARYVVVSQGFHTRRAIWLARRHGIEAFGFDARDVPARVAPQVWLRNYASAVRAFWDVTLGTRPRHGGPIVRIGVDPPN
jgi:SanA protein